MRVRQVRFRGTPIPSRRAILSTDFEADFRENPCESPVDASTPAGGHMGFRPQIAPRICTDFEINFRENPREFAVNITPHPLFRQDQPTDSAPCGVPIAKDMRDNRAAGIEF
jgi:hypothetical protein